jgi:LmbE family N-acetylglucosaminyl deacetylase
MSEPEAEIPAVVVSPHLDDAVLSAWSVLTAAGPVEVVNVFDGLPEPGFLTRYDRLVRGTESATLFAERIAEDREALALAGRTPRGVGLLERQYRDRPYDPDRLERLLEAAIPRCSELYVPSGIGGHEDHVAVRDAALGLAAGGPPVTLYAELPYAIHKGWPHWVTGDDPDPHLDPESDWEVYLSEVPCGRSALEVRVRELSDGEAEAKLAALRTYRTQFASLNSGMINRFGAPVASRYEVFWRVGPSDG